MDEEVKSKLIMDKEDLAGEEIESTGFSSAENSSNVPKFFKERMAKQHGNTKDEISALNRFFKGINVNKLNSLLYDELYDESDFVFYAVDYVNDIEELETLLDSSNQTLLLKVLTTLKEMQALNSEHKKLALSHITSDNIKQMVEVL